MAKGLWAPSIKHPAISEQSGNDLLVSKGLTAQVRHVLGLGSQDRTRSKPLSRVIPTLDAAMSYADGIRILRQPVWECLATFLTSALKQVAHIRSISLLIRERYGRKLEIARDGCLYPGPEVLAGLTLGEIVGLPRWDFAQQIYSRLLEWLPLVRSNSTAWPSCRRTTYRSVLRRFKGVGDKIANCVLLFAFGRLEVMPIDVWIARVLREKYFPEKSTIRPAQLADFCQQHFGPYAGYAQQYLFHHWRLTYRDEKVKSKN